MMLQEVLTAAGVKEGDTVLDLCAGHQSMEEAATQKGPGMWQWTGWQSSSVAGK